MNFPPYWARGENGNFFCWRWSFQSLAEAQSLANEAARQLAQRFREGVYPAKGGQYYPDRPAREQVLQEIKDRNGVSAVVTRNSYGCLVVNTARAMFVDIDLPEPPGKSGNGFLSRLFGKPKPPEASPQTAENEALAKVENWTRNNYQWGWRVYRTRSGLRLLATQGLVEANSPTCDDIFQALGADPLYRKLCKTQKCFRARLTPKPWRCGIGSRPARWPWLTPKEEQKFQKWETKYKEASTEWATCAFVRQIGNTSVHPDVQTIIKLHDEATRVESNLPLA